MMRKKKNHKDIGYKKQEPAITEEKRILMMMRTGPKVRAMHPTSRLERPGQAKQVRKLYSRKKLVKTGITRDLERKFRQLAKNLFSENSIENSGNTHRKTTLGENQS